MGDWELAAVEGGQDRLCLHLRVEHDARIERDAEAWEDGSWEITVFPGETWSFNLSGD